MDFSKVKFLRAFKMQMCIVTLQEFDNGEFDIVVLVTFFIIIKITKEKKRLVELIVLGAPWHGACITLVPVRTPGEWQMVECIQEQASDYI
jgi:hypothetical protein